ncbi:putative F420-dependent oxidoreductase [Actinomycetospora succinea]|uniref:Putative F420-dependent oxidoreductase n=1 Tax=Actinomycetospora succinea TaxID=663603 RepID=A0A4R6UPQ9_9PSEU|nr:TIGR03619 family F420-dependent LLM class oxidoreductase [Actinomycetospora succinea]TDQ48882.1 putative F420-dependent oxidoreductase [Actinomycetospora succinea]
MEVGLGLPNGGADVDPGELVRLAVGAERIGLDAVWVVDRWLRPHAPVAMPGVPVLVTMPAEYYASVYDPIDLLCHLAARTDRIGLGTSAINVLYHPPVLLARRLATLDRLSSGRARAGVTSGWMAEEFAVADVPPSVMGEGFDEHLAAMRAVWAPDPVERDGTRFPIPRSDIGPKPVGAIPLLVGYNTAAGLRRAARIGDGLHPHRNGLAHLARDLEQWRADAQEAGRDPAMMPVVLRVAADPTAADAPGEVFTGPPERWPADLVALEALGVDHVLLQFPPGTSVDETLAVMTPLSSGTRAAPS